MFPLGHTHTLEYSNQKLVSVTKQIPRGKSTIFQGFILLYLLTIRNFGSSIALTLNTSFGSCCTVLLTSLVWRLFRLLLIWISVVDPDKRTRRQDHGHHGYRQDLLFCFCETLTFEGNLPRQNSKS